MKELVYRRELGGYQATHAAGLSQGNRSRGTQYSMTCMDEKDDNVLCYRQVRMDDGTVAVGASYVDPLLKKKDKTEKRKTAMSHMLFIQADEVAALLDGYPSSSSYFLSFREGFEKTEQLPEPAQMEIPLRAYQGRAGGLESAPAILKNTFKTQETLAAVFEALLDASSKNTRMVVIFGQEEDSVKLAEAGRRIIEALFVCLPNVVARYLGYISPAVEDKDNSLFCVRYSAPRAIGGGMRPHTYTFDIETQALNTPGNANHAAKEYADELAQLVFTADAASFERIRWLKKLLNDNGLYDVKDVPKELALRYRFYNALSKKSINMLPADMRDLLDKHNEAIAEAEKGADLDASSLWKYLDRWLITMMLPHIYERIDGWKDTDAVFSRKRVREIYNAGQRLYLLGRPEAEGYYKFFEGRIGRKPLMDAGYENKVPGELLDYVIGQLKGAEDANLATRALYWLPIERWMRANWENGRLLGNAKALEAVCLLYKLDNESGSRYMDPYARYCLDNGVSPLTVVKSEFGRAVFEKTLRGSTAYMKECIRRDLGNRLPYSDPETFGRFKTYRGLVKGDGELTQAFIDELDASERKMLSGFTIDRLEEAMAELASDEQNGVLGVFYQLDPQRDVRGKLEMRIAEIAKADGVYRFYPQKAKLAADLADLMDKCMPNLGWGDRLTTLKQTYTLDLANLDDETFHALMKNEMGAGDDGVLAKNLRSLLWGNITATFNADSSDMKALLKALALHNNGRSGFNTEGIMKDLEKIGVKEKKFLAACKKLAKSGDTEGAAYIASGVLRYDAGELRRFGDNHLPYPAMHIRAEGRAQSRKSAGRGMFAGFPAAVAVVMVVFGASGLAASLLGLLNYTGLL